MKTQAIWSIVIISAFYGAVSAPAFAGAAAYVERGNEKFAAGDYDAALQLYHQGQNAAPAAPEILYNMATVFYRQGEYGQAVDANMQAGKNASDAVQAKAAFNAGNSFFQQGNFSEALASYKKALAITPGDEDIKYNIEYTQKKMQQMRSQAQQTQQRAERNNREHAENDQNSPANSGQTKEKPNAEQGEKERQNEKEPDQEKEEQKSGTNGDNASASGNAAGSSAQQPGPASERSEKEDASSATGETTKEQAERFLSAFDKDQKNMLPFELNRKGHSADVEKDW